MEAYRTIRAQLKKLGERDLFELARRKERRWCNVGARECGFLILYEDLGFCLTELLGKGCSPHLELEDAAENRGGSR